MGVGAAEGGDDIVAEYGQQSWELRQTLPVGHQLQLCVALTYLPGKDDWYAHNLG